MSDKFKKLYIEIDTKNDWFNVFTYRIDNEVVEYIRADLVPTWRDMDSAPKDGRYLFGKDAEGRIRVIQYFVDNNLVWHTDEGEGFMPIKWMPIPK